jgi:RimJ/RimL family protein N-acetyltransferase
MRTIRQVREDDAESFLSLCKRLDEESKFMMLEPGERRTTLEEQRQRLRNLLSRESEAIFVAEDDGRLTGYLSASGGHFARNKHTAYIVIGVLEEFTGRGLGTALFEALEKWAKQRGLRRLELSVMVHNERGVALYQKMGFEKEGTKRDSLLVDGSYVDEYYMAKLI